MTQFPIKLFEGQTNFVKFLRFHPCAEPLPILVETFFPCFLQMAIDLYIIDEQDVAMNTLKEYPRYGKGKAAARGQRHSFKKEKSGKQLTRRQVKNVPFLHKPIIKGTTTFLYNVAAPLEKIGFVMMFYSAVDKFFYNWTTLLAHRGYCELPAFTGPLQRSANAGAQIASPGGNPVSMPNLLQNRGAWPSNATGAGLLPGEYTVIWQAKVKNNTTTYMPGLRLKLSQGSFPIALNVEHSDPVDIAPGDEADLVLSCVIDFPVFVLNGIWWEMDTVVALLLNFDLVSSTICIYQNYTEISY